MKHFNVNVAVLGTPKCGHALLMNLLDSVYSLRVINDYDFFAETTDLVINKRGVIFNSHYTPSRSNTFILTKNSSKIICPIRNPLDCLLSLLYFYRRHDKNNLTADQLNLITGIDVLNDRVLEFVLSGRFESLYCNSFLWRAAGGYLVKFEDLINRPFDTLKEICKIIEPVSDREIRAACLANTFNLFSSFSENALHIMDLNKDHLRKYDWENLRSQRNGNQIYDYIITSPIYEPYRNYSVKSNIIENQLKFGSEIFSSYQKLFYLSEIYLEFEDDQVAFEVFKKYAESPVDTHELIVLGLCMEIYRRRQDLKEAFPCPLDSDRLAFINWFLFQATAEYKIPSYFLKDMLQSVVKS